MENDNVLRAVDMSGQQIVDIESQLTSAFNAVKRYTIHNYGDASHIKKVRDGFKSGKITMHYDPAAKRAMTRMLALEPVVLGAFIRIADKLCRAFADAHDKRPGTSICDYEQEAAFAIYDAMYTYNGEQKFTTYAYWCVKHRLLDFVRKEDNRAQSGSRRSLSPDTPGRSDTEGEAEKSEELVMLRAAIAAAPLNPLERELLEAVLSGDKTFGRFKERVNPNTGVVYSKQRLSQILTAAKHKVAERMRSPGRSEAA